MGLYWEPCPGGARLLRLLGGDPEGKMRRLLDFTRHPRDIDDPWYTGDFVTAYRDIEAGCAALLDVATEGSPQRQKCVGVCGSAVNRDTAVIGGGNKKAPAKGTFR